LSNLYGRDLEISLRDGRWSNRFATTCTSIFGSVTSTLILLKPRGKPTNRGRAFCRDFAHLAITLCRCMNIPARYCTGYLGDIGVPPDLAPMDFSAWFEVFLGERWYTFDARHNIPRIGRILMARGRDATDVAISTSFGPCQLTGFKVFTDEVHPAAS
jgi:transglutaminase-like putative cysteine protease